MYLRRCYRAKDGKRHAYWALVKSVRTTKGPRQEIVAYLGDLDEAGRLGVQQAADHGKSSSRQRELFDTPQPRYVEVDLSGVVVEGTRKFGGPWLALQLIGKLGLKSELDHLMPIGREEVPWSIMSLVLVICRLCDPSSELRIAEHLYERSALPDLLGVDAGKINDDRLYRALDELLPHKAALETHLKQRLGELFNLGYDLLLYDVTSPYFEGQCNGNEQARRGYSRDSRGDCKQVCIALVVSRCGMPLGYELFAGNKADVTTVKEIVTTMEKRYGKADRIWVMDRGMVSAANVEFLKEGNRRYIMGTHKTLLRRYEKKRIAPDWNVIHEGLEVKLCPDPDGGTETFILCRSAARREKEKAMHEKFEKRIEEGLASLVKLAEKRPMTAVQVAHWVGRLLGQTHAPPGRSRPK
jgi:Transposase DDE domain